MNRTTGGDAVFVGLDLGTSGLKAVALDVHGTPVARAGSGYPTSTPQPGAYEQDPGHWCAAAATAVAELSAQLGERLVVRALGLSGMLPTLVAVDAELHPVAPAITWQDARAESYGQRLRDAVGGDEIYRLTGQWLDGRYLLPMYLALTARGRSEPARYLLGAKDWLLAWLTGHIATDPSTASGVGAYRLDDGRWHAPLLDAATEFAGRPLPELPQVVPSEAAFAARDEAARSLGLTPGPAGLCRWRGLRARRIGARRVQRRRRLRRRHEHCDHRRRRTLAA